MFFIYRIIITFFLSIFLRLVPLNYRNRLLVFVHPRNQPRQIPVDCLIEILEHLRNDTSALHSCILVNRIWCLFAVRILWRSPFEHVNSEKYGSLAIRTYISCLSDQEKQKLINNGIEIPNLNQPYLDYPGFLQSFDYYGFISSVHSWLIEIMGEDDIPDDELIKDTAQIIGEMICRRSPGFKELKYLRKESTNMINMTLMDLSNYNGVIDALSKLQRFEFRSSNHADDDFTRNWIKLFTKISTSTRNLQHITICLSKNNRDTFKELDHSISDLIRSQSRLQSISVNSFWSVTNSSLIYDAILFHSRSLNYLRLQGLSDLPLLFQVLNSCENLEILEFTRSWKKDDDFYHGNIIPSTSLKIKHLYYYFIDDSVDFLNTILKISKNNLKTFSSKQFNPSVITTIRNYCPNITHLCVKLRPSDLLLFNEQLLNTLQLEHLTIQTPYGPPLSKDQLYQLALALPQSCKYFGIDFEIGYAHLDHFLRHIRYAKLEILALHSISDNHVKYLESAIAYAIGFKSLNEVKLQKVNHNSDLTDSQYKKWLNEQLLLAFKRFDGKYDYPHDLKISEAKPISFSYHETVFKSKIINFTT
ncbi:hypothetical protein C1645_732059 [Glomus cerebriforme]|uniref:F-box domain-containing protein n=1 Tax=Glomus cerebriforme TaxID=658196 RepID=A0A397TSR6_9GLOM|nr:hypothetical protein C1645_732059 [Glomus cerebriforme]